MADPSHVFSLNLAPFDNFLFASLSFVIGLIKSCVLPFVIKLLGKTSSGKSYEVFAMWWKFCPTKILPNEKFAKRKFPTIRYIQKLNVISIILSSSLRVFVALSKFPLHTTLPNSLIVILLFFNWSTKIQSFCKKLFSQKF